VYDVLVERRNITDSIPTVGAYWNEKAKSEIIVFGKLVLEVVALNHSKVGDWVLAGLKLKVRLDVEGSEYKVCSRKWRVSDCCVKKASWTSSRPSSTIPFTRTS